MEATGKSLLSDDEQNRVTQVYLTGRLTSTPVEEEVLAQELSQVLAWANLVRLQAAMLDGILRGECLVGWRDGQTVFWRPSDQQTARLALRPQ